MGEKSLLFELSPKPKSLKEILWSLDLQQLYGNLTEGDNISGERMSLEPDTSRSTLCNSQGEKFLAKVSLFLWLGGL